MRRVHGIVVMLLVGVASQGRAQVSMATPDGWTFTFAGNVGAFYLFEHESRAGQVASPAALVGTGHQGSAIRSGYLPAFAVLDAKGMESNVQLNAHFGLAPVVQTAGGHDDSAGLGARLDVRQAYLAVSGQWGRVLAGRELGVFGRQSMLNDMSLFGVGATGTNPGSTTLGHSGYGYIYPGFNAQLTYSTPDSAPLQATVAVFDPSTNNGFSELVAPRLEAELQWEQRGTSVWLSGLLQPERDTVLGSATAWGVSAGGRIARGALALAAHGYVGRGIGTTTLFREARTSDTTSVALRKSDGAYAQLTLRPRGGPLTVGIAAGASRLTAAADEAYFQTVNRAGTVGAYLQATRSLKVIGEVTEAWSSDADVATRTNRSTAVALGMLLFF